MPSFTEVHFGGAFVVNEATDGFNVVEGDVGDVAMAQPGMNEPALEGGGHGTQVGDDKVGVRWARDETGEPFFFGAEDFSGSPQGAADIAAHGFLESGQEIVPEAVAGVVAVEIGGIV